MQSTSLPHLVGGVLFLGGVVVALLRARRVELPPLRLVAPNVWVLDHLCRSTGPMLRSGFTAKRVAIDLIHIAHLDASSLASLDHACLRWAEVGVRVTIEGCNRKVAEAIHRHGLRVEVRRQQRVEDFDYATTLH